MWCQQAVGLVLGGIGQELSRDPFHTPRIWVSGEQGIGPEENKVIRVYCEQPNSKINITLKEFKFP